jgi:hypothetical protein
MKDQEKRSLLAVAARGLLMTRASPRVATRHARVRALQAQSSAVLLLREFVLVEFEEAGEDHRGYYAREFQGLGFFGERSGGD